MLPSASRRSGVIDLREIEAAALRIAPFVTATPVMSSHVLNRQFGRELFFKCENFQKIGAFKARGAHNAVFSLTPAEAVHGVVTHSSGNHAAALSLAARNRNIPAYIVMPENALKAKIASVERNGGIITFCAPTQSAREDAARALCTEKGARLIHPFDDERIIAGQATAALEFIRENPSLDAIIAPLGGGGLLAGTALASHALNPNLNVFGAEPRGADDGVRGFRSGQRQPQPNPQTIADGLRTAVGERNFPLIRQYVTDIIPVEEASIIAAMRLIWEVLKIVIEPSGAVPLAALLENKLPPEFHQVGLILSGGNVDLDALPWSSRS